MPASGSAAPFIKEQALIGHGFQIVPNWFFASARRVNSVIQFGIQMGF
jgi:hypothetical protein